VDIIIPTVHESLAIVRRTLVGCLEQDYPRHQVQIYVADDGHRSAVEQLARQYGVHYLARPDRRDAKAGNLNWALAHSRGDMIVIFDADMVPKPHALRRLIAPLVADPACAFVQAPQAFFNPDPFQHNLGLHQQLPNEQDFFMRTLEAARARFNAVLFVGSNAAFRRTALAAIGGFPTGTITEDAATSLLLQAHGWRGVFIPAIVAEGLAAESLGEFLGQRTRWCRGNIQVAKRWNPLTLPGLSPMQRLIYLSGTLYWYFGLQKLIYLAAPLAFLDLGIRSVFAPALTLVLLWLPSWATQWGTFRQLSHGTRTVWWSHVYEVVQAPSLAWAALAETLGWHLAHFRVTAKDLHQPSRQIVWPTFTVMGLLLIASLVGLLRSVALIHRHPAAWGFDVLADAWTLYNAAALVAGIAVSVDWPRWRTAERFAVQRPVTLSGPGYTGPAVTHDLSETGVALILPVPTSMAADARVTVTLEGTPLPGRIRRWEPENPKRLGVRWGPLTAEQYRVVWRLTYGQPTPFRVLPDPGLIALGHGLVRRWRIRVFAVQRKSASRTRPMPPPSQTLSG
jgi:cellulose synthase (UDP-forming)